MNFHLEQMENLLFLGVPILKHIRVGGKTISLSRQEWTLPAKLGKLKTGQDGFVVVVALLFYVHGKHLRSCRDGHLT